MMINFSPWFEIAAGAASSRRTRALLPVLALVFVSNLHAATVVLQPVKDNTIYDGVIAGETIQNNTCGAGPNLFAGTNARNPPKARRALLAFDIAGNMPAGAVINDVTLTVTHNLTPDLQLSTMTLHPLTRDWGEGTVDCTGGAVGGGGGGGGALANSGAATWLSAEHLLTPWTLAGGDFGPASASTLATFQTGQPITWDSASSPGMITDVQNWLDSPGSNFGWAVLGNEAAAETVRRFGSRESATPPVLTVDFTPPGSVEACCFADGDCTLLTASSCTGQGGTPDTNSTSCTPNPCPQPNGACCNQDESCSDTVPRDVCEDAGGAFQGASSLCSSVDCGLQPFVDALPVPGVLAPTGTRADGVLQYEVAMTQRQQQLHRDLPPTDVWTYAGSFPGPTIEATTGQPIEVKYINNLPAGTHYLDVDTCAHGPNYWDNSPRTVPHLHGGHVPARFDGQPEYDFMPGAFDTYEYPNNQPPATLWYHDHALGITRLNVYMGLAGFYLVRDGFEAGLGLPSGEFEIPLVVQDRQFNPDGSLFYPAALQDHFHGDKVLVNGKVWPYLNVKQGKYRFRLLNGSSSRIYDVRLENPANPGQVIPFNLIGTDGGLIDAPMPLNTINIAPAERFDVVVDFSGLAPGTEIVLRNDDATSPQLPNIMKFIVTTDTGFTGPLPAALRAVTSIPEAQAAGTRHFRLTRRTDTCTPGQWVIESLDGPNGNVIGGQWDDITEYPVLGDTEIWEFENNTDLMHPMHVHLVLFQVLDKVDRFTGQPIPLEPWEINTWKDTVQVPRFSKVRVIMRFEDYPGKFAYHCHILDHEDHEMMRQFQTTHDPANCNSNGLCEDGEDCISCAADCAQVTGASCGNGLCEAGDGENCVTCPADCAGDQSGTGVDYCCGFDSGATNNPLLCGEDTSGNRCIDASQNRFCRLMPRVQACCGDALCEGGESDVACGIDCLDTDSDGFPDTVDSDDDNDSVPDYQDAFPLNPAEWLDTDGDGTGNNADTDDDNDGLSDNDEILIWGTDPLLDDTDADGWLDNAEVTAGSDPVCIISVPGSTGDGNGDAQVNITDVLLLNRILMGMHTPTLAEQQQLNVAPLVNGTPEPDCALNVGDMVIVMRKVLGLVGF
jgi:spore coat protein A